MTGHAHPGDILLLAAVRKHLRRPLPSDIDTPARSLEAEVALATSPLTAVDLESTFGPGWLGAITLIRQAAALTDQQIEDLSAACDSFPEVAWTAAGAAASRCADGTGSAALMVTWYTARQCRISNAGADSAARRAAWAVATRHLVDAHWYTELHYDALLRPWMSVMGDPFAVQVTL